MILAFQLAYRNLMGAGLRTWLNAAVLSFAFVVILFFNGLLDGWNQQAKRDNIEWEYGKGQLIHADYDPFDPFSVQDGHGILPTSAKENLVPILIRQASVYPEGRMLSISLKGIEVPQEILGLPTDLLENSKAEIPAIIGKRMATSANLKVNDELLLRWRDKNGTFDAKNVTIVGIFDSNVPTIDNGQFWIPIKKLWEMTGMEGHATMFISEADQPVDVPGWNFRSQEDLLRELSEIIEMKKASSSIMYILLLAIALLAIFDTQVLSIFRRQKEIGTYISLGMTRQQVVGLFTVEGGMYSIFAMVLGCAYGIPLLLYLSATGIGIPEASQNMGVSLADRIYPVYGIVLILGTIALVVISATIVSYLPARKIAKMDPVNAIKGKLQ